MSSFGNYLKRKRQNAGLTQSRLAEKMNVSTNTVQNWEKGNTSVDYSRFVDLAYIFNVSEMEIFHEFCLEESNKRPNNWPDFLFDDVKGNRINEIVDALHLNMNQQELFGLLYLYHAEYLQKEGIDYNTIYDDLHRVPYGFIEKVGSIHFMNIVDGLQRVIKYVKSDFLLKILKQNPDAEFDVRRLTKDQICEFITSGYKESYLDYDENDDPERFEGGSDLYFNINMEKAKKVLPLLVEDSKDSQSPGRPIHITDGGRMNKIRKDVPQKIIESLEMLHIPYDLWKNEYESLDANHNCFLGIHAYIGLERVTEYHNTAPEGEEETWYLEINEKGRSLLEWLNSKE